MFKRFWLMVLLILLQNVVFAKESANVVKPESVELSSQRLERIDQHIEENKIAGAVVLVARKGKIAYFR